MAVAAVSAHLTFFFIFPILLHHNEVIYKNNYLLYTNIFSEYNRLHINCLVEVLIIFKLILRENFFLPSQANKGNLFCDDFNFQSMTVIKGSS